jgi:hypothetical protein
MAHSSSRRLFSAPGLLFLLCLALLPGSGRAEGLKASSPVPGPRLVVSDFATGKTIVSLPVKISDRFVIRYIHSVDHTPIFEQFRLDPKRGLVLEKTWFTMFGAGLGHWPGHGHLTQDKNWITISDMERPVGSFVLRIGALSVGHTIIYHDREINLSRLAAGTRVRVEFRPGKKRASKTTENERQK